MKKIIIITLVVLILGAAAWVILLRPSSITKDSVKEDFENTKADFAAVAEYLTKNSVKAEIKGLITHDTTYGVPNIDEDEYRKFNNAVEGIMALDIDSIISDGKSIEFRYQSSGGILERKIVSVIYNGKQSVDGKQTEPLGSGWHLCAG